MDLPPSSFGTNKGKSKGKHVGFSDDVEITRLPSPPEPEESDLTDLTEVENSINKLKPSPRRLRSKGSVSRLSHDKSRPDDAHETARRITPMRKAKGKVGNLNESTDEEAEEEDELVSDAQEDEEVDELQEPPSPNATPKPKAALMGRRTPVRNRLRARHLQTHTPPSDGDDEGSEEEGTVVAGEEGDDEGSDEEQPEEEAEPAEPRRLRNGKIVADEDIEEDIGEEDDEDDEDEEEEEQEEEDEVDDSESTTSTIDEGDVDADGEEDEVMDDDDGISVLYVVAASSLTPISSSGPHCRHSEDACSPP